MVRAKMQGPRNSATGFGKFCRSRSLLIGAVLTLAGAVGVLLAWFLLWAAATALDSALRAYLHLLMLIARSSD